MHLLSNARSYWESVKLTTKKAVYKWTHRKALRKSLEDANHNSDSNSDDASRPLRPEVTISSQTEIGQTEESVKVPKQRTYIDRKPVISSSLANIPCSSLDFQGLLDLLNITLGTSYTLDTPSLYFVLEDCIAHNYDFGTAYGCLRKAWYDDDIHVELQERRAKDIKWRRNVLNGSQIFDKVKIYMKPRRVWDLYSNRVVPWWSCKVDFRASIKAQPISHAWVDGGNCVDVWTPINGYEWPVPIPKGANLDLIRIEMLNLGLEYTWLDVLCLRQRGGPGEDLRVEEWKLDVPTIGAIYDGAHVVWYLSGLGLPLSLKEGDLESDRCWFRRAWTVQEIGWRRTIAGDTLDGPLYAEPIDEVGNYEDEILTKFHRLLKSAGHGFVPTLGLYGKLSMMQDRISTNPVDKVAGLAFSLETHSILAYYESQSLEDAWTALINGMDRNNRGILFFTYPEPGSGCNKWRPSWEQVMTKPLPKEVVGRVANIERNDNDWYVGLRIGRGFVRGLAVEGVEGIDRCGELVVEDAVGKAHSFNIVASHQYPIPEDTYTLLSSDSRNSVSIRYYEMTRSPQYWVVGRQLPNKRFEKVSVFTMPDLGQVQRLKVLRLYAKSRTVLA